MQCLDAISFTVFKTTVVFYKDCLDDAVFKNYSITKLWFYKLKRHKIVVEKKEVMSEFLKLQKDHSFDKIHGFRDYKVYHPNTQ